MRSAPENSGRCLPPCSACGRETELFQLPGSKERDCFECSADVATTILLAAEIDAASKSGEDTGGLRAEGLQIGMRHLARAQSQ